MDPDTLRARERNGASRKPGACGTSWSSRRWTIPPVRLVGDGLAVPCLDGEQRPYLNLDTGASTNALPAVAERVHEFLPWYSSVHRGAGYKSQQATGAYEQARAAALRFAGRRPDADDVAVICRNTTDAINHLAKGSFQRSVGRRLIAARCSFGREPAQHLRLLGRRERSLTFGNAPLVDLGDDTLVALGGCGRLIRCRSLAGA